MAIILEGSGTVTGITTFITPLDDIKFDSIEVTGIATASTFQVGTGVSIGNPRLQNIALYTNDSEWVTVDNVGNVGFGTTNAQIAADTNNAKVINAGIVTANQYFGNQLTAVGANITGVSTFTGDMEALTGLLAHDQIAAHAGDTNTRIRFPAADTITAETAGSERVRITSDGNLGLGINSPVSRLHVHNSGTGSGDHSYAYFTTGDTGSSASDGLTVGVAANQVATVNYREAGALSLGTNSTERLRITSAGLVGIGTAVPAIPSGGGLEIHHSSVARLKLSTTSTGVGANDGFQIYMSDSSAILENKENAEMRFYTNALERVRIDSSGRLLIGTTDTDSVSDGEVSKLIIKGTDSTASASFTRHSADAGGTGLYLGKSRNATIGSNTIVQNNDELGRITFSGDDGTNINTMGAKIASYVDGTPGENDMPGRLIFYTTADGAASVTERMRITEGGNVSIGGRAPVPTDPAYNKALLHIHQTQSGTYGSELHLTNNTTGSAAGDGMFLSMWTDNSVYFTNQEAGDIRFTTNGHEAFKIQSNKNVKITDGNLIIDTAGHGIDFSATGGPTNGSGTSELLDDYEEGTWTPNITFSNGGNTATYGANTGGWYVKVGRMVTLNGRIQISAKGAGSSAVYFGGLPFTVGNYNSGSSGVEGGLTLTYLSDVNADKGSGIIGGYANENTTNAIPFYVDTGNNFHYVEDFDLESTASIGFLLTYCV